MENNDLLYEVEVADEIETGETPDVVKLVQALDGLLKSRNFKIVVDLFFKPRLLSRRMKAETEKDPVEIYRGQGAIGEGKLIVNLSAVLDALRNTIEPNGKKETTE